MAKTEVAAQVLQKDPELKSITLPFEVTLFGIHGKKFTTGMDGGMALRYTDGIVVVTHPRADGQEYRVMPGGQVLHFVRPASE